MASRHSNINRVVYIYMPLYLNSANLTDISEAISEAGDVVMAAYNNKPTQNIEAVKPDMVTTALRQLIDIMHMIEEDQASDIVYKDTVEDNTESAELYELDVSPLSCEEISEIGDHGLSLIQTLSEWAGTFDLNIQRQQLHAVMVIVSIWIARHGGFLRNLDTIVNTLADIANKTSDEKILAELSFVMGEIIGAVDTDFQYIAVDMAVDSTQIQAAILSDHAVTSKNSQAGDTREECWRLLNINRGIIATRTHDIKIMEPVFEQLIKNIPDYAPVFFEKGVREVEALDYPENIRLVMDRYYKKYASNTLH